MNTRLMAKINETNALIASLGLPDIGFSYYSRRRVWFRYANKRGAITLQYFTAIRQQLKDFTYELESAQRVAEHLHKD